jgi:putative heme-binding domain-containing protein
MYPERTKLAFTLATSLIERLASASGKLDPTTQSGQRLQTLCREAASHANDLSRPESERVAAAGLLAALPWKEARVALIPLLDRGQDDAVRLAAFSALTRFPEEEASVLLASLWDQVTPRVRAEFLSSTLSRPARTAYLLDAIESGRIQPTDLSSTQLDQLRNNRDGTLRERAQKLLTSALSSRADAVATFQAALDLDGDAARGRRIFTERCASCHKMNGEGQAVGPDLASAKASGKPKLLLSIVDPNREVPPNFFNYVIDTKSGESFSGIIASESGANVTLRRAFGEETVVSRANIQRIQSSTLSLMPEGLETGLSAQDLADLMEFIVAGDRK